MNHEAMSLLKIAVAMIPLCAGFFVAAALAQRRRDCIRAHIWRTLGRISAGGASAILLAAGMLMVFSLSASP